MAKLRGFRLITLREKIDGRVQVQSGNSVAKTCRNKLIMVLSGRKSKSLERLDARSQRRHGRPDFLGGAKIGLQNTRSTNIINRQCRLAKQVREQMNLFVVLLHVLLFAVDGCQIKPPHWNDPKIQHDGSDDQGKSEFERWWSLHKRENGWGK